MSSTALVKRAKRKMSDLKPGALVNVLEGYTQWAGGNGATLVGTVIDGPFYQEPDDPERLGWWSYKILSRGGIRHIDDKHLELLDETVG
jgi:hypothetical protein